MPQDNIFYLIQTWICKYVLCIAEIAKILIPKPRLSVNLALGLDFLSLAMG